MLQSTESHQALWYIHLSEYIPIYFMLYIRSTELWANTRWIFNEWNMKCNVDKMKNNSNDDDLKDSKIIYKTISGGLIASITKSILQHGLFWIMVYILGWYNFSWKVSYRSSITYYMIWYNSRKIVNNQQKNHVQVLFSGRLHLCLYLLLAKNGLWEHSMAGKR